MPERKGRSDQSVVVKIVVAAVMSIAVSLFSFGCGYVKKFEIENYEAFLHNLTQYGNKDNPDAPQIPPTPNDPNISETPTGKPNGTEGSGFIQIRGFEPLIEENFSTAGKFSDGYAFIKTDENQCFLIDRQGERYEIASDFCNNIPKNLLYVTHSTEFYGAKNIFDEIILEEIFDFIEIHDHIILAISAKTAIIYCGTAEISRSEFDDSVTLLGDSYLLKDGVICDLYFDEMTACGYPYKDLPSEGVVTVDIGDGYFAYANVETQEVIAGPFIAANRFSDGFASAQTPKGTYVVVDIVGSTVYESDRRIVGEKSGRYFCFLQDGLYGAMDENFKDVTKPIFAEVIYEKPIGDYLAVRYGGGARIYSLIEGDFVSEIYDSISYEDDLFICTSEDKCFVMNLELQILAECEFAAYSEEILLIRIDGKYTYYKRSTDE